MIVCVSISYHYTDDIFPVIFDTDVLESISSDSENSYNTLASQWLNIIMDICHEGDAFLERNLFPETVEEKDWPEEAVVTNFPVLVDLCCVIHIES